MTNSTADTRIRLHAEGVDQVDASMRRVAGSVDSVGISAKQTAAALRGVPAQFTDIVTSLASGQAPLTVLVQQGGQLKDMFGGAGAAARALSGYVAGLVNPFTIAAAGVGALAFAYHEGASEVVAYQRAVILSGNAAGVTAGQLGDMAARISSVVGTQREAAAAVAEFASSTKISGDNMQRLAEVAVRMERSIGQPIAETRKEFEELAKSPVEALAKLDEKYGHLTASVYKQVQALQDQGREAEAGRAAQDAHATAMEERTKKLVESLGTLERSWQGVKEAAASAWSRMLNIGREDTLSEQLKAVNSQIAEREARLATPVIGVGGGRRFEELKAGLEMLRLQRDALQEVAALEGDSARAAAARVSIERERVAWMRDGEQLKSKDKKLAEEIEAAERRGAKLGLDREEIEKRILALKAKYADKGAEAKVRRELEAQKDLLASLSGLSSSFYDDWDRLTKLWKSGGFGEGEEGVNRLQEALGKLLQKQPAMEREARAVAAALKEEEKWLSEIAKAHAEASLLESKAAKDTEDLIKRLKEEAESYGLSADQIARRRLQRELDSDAARIAQLEAQDTIGLSAEQIAWIDREIERLKELSRQRIATANAAGNQRAADSMQQFFSASAREAERWADQIGQSLSNSIMDGGKNAHEYLTALFRTTALQPMFRPIGDAFAGGMRSVMGPASPGAMPISGWDSAMNLMNGFNAGYSTLFTRFATSSFGQSAGLGLPGFEGIAGGPSVAPSLTGVGEAFGDALPYLTSIAQIAQGDYTSAALSAIGTAIAGPVGTVIGTLVGGLVNKLGAGETRGGSSYGYSATGAPTAILNDWTRSLIAGSVMSLGGPSGGALGGADGDKMTAAAVHATVLGIDTLFEKLGSPDRIDAFWGKLETSDRGRGGVLSGGRLASGAAFGETGFGSNYAGTLFESTSPFNMSAEEAAKAFGLDLKQATIQALQAASDIPQMIAEQLAGVDAEALTDEAATALLAQIDSVATAIDGFREAVKTLPFESLKALSFDAAAGLIEVSGGLDALKNNLATYYQEFYTQAERESVLRRQITESLAAVNIALPESRDAFRAIVEAQDLSTESGRQAYATLLSVNGAFAQLTPAADDAAAAVGGVADAMSETMRRLTGDSRSLQVGLLRAQGDVTGASALQREIDTSGMSEAEKALYDYNQSLRDQIVALDAAAESQRSATQERLGLEARLLQLQGDVTAVRARELEALDPSNRALQELVWSLEDTAAAAQTAAESERNVAQQRLGLEGRLLQLLGDTAEIRRRELAALDPSNQALQQFIYGLEDMRIAIDAAKTAARDSAAARIEELQSQKEAFSSDVARVQGLLQRSSEAEMSRIAAVEQAKVTGLQTQIEAMGALTSTTREHIGALESLMGALGNASDALRDLPSLTAQTYGQAVARFDQMLAGARLGGAPDAGELRSVLGTITSRGGDSYGSRFAFERDRLVQANKADEMSRLLGVQLSAEERMAVSQEAAVAALQKEIEATRLVAQTQREAIEAQLQSASDTINKLLGVDTSIVSMDAAMRQVAELDDKYQVNHLKLLDDEIKLSEYALKEDLKRLDGIWGATTDTRAGAWATYGATQGVASAVHGVSAAVFDLARELSGDTGTTAPAPAFAAGGMHAGGLRLVGERGPELEVTGPARIFDARATREMLTGGTGTSAELAALREEQRAQARSMAALQLRTAKILERWEIGGLPAARTETA